MSIELSDRLSALLPSTRADEPASLRQDILDELADHLTCGYDRELHRGFDPGSAMVHTLQSFGDPAAVARRLWSDAMKGKIMAQRILIATCLVVMAVCVAVVVSVGVLIGRFTTETSFTSGRIVQVLKESQTTNQEVMRHLQAIDASAQSRHALESSIVHFRLALEIPSGPPASGFEVRFGRGSGGSNRNDAQYGMADERGEVGFEVDLPGDWEYTVSRTVSQVSGTNPASPRVAAAGGMGAMMGMMSGPGGETTWKTRGMIKVVAGGTSVKQIVCPELPPDSSPVRMRVNFPIDLAARNLRLEIMFLHTGFQIDSQARWWIENPNRPNLYQSRSFLLGPDLRQGEVVDQDSLYLWRLVDGKDSSAALASRGFFGTRSVFADLRTELVHTEPNSLELELGTYRMARLVVLRSRSDQDPKIKGERFDMIAHTELVHTFALPVHQCEQSPDEPSPIEVEADKKIGRVSISEADWNKVNQEGAERIPAFEVKPGRSNLWTISLPDELTRAVRERLGLKEPVKSN